MKFNAKQKNWNERNIVLQPRCEKAAQ